jgi:hypothetical protein
MAVRDYLRLDNRVCLWGVDRQSSCDRRQLGLRRVNRHAFGKPAEHLHSRGIRRAAQRCRTERTPDLVRERKAEVFGHHADDRRLLDPKPHRATDHACISEESSLP